MVKGIQEKKEIPPLLPLEYCTVERAARLIGCEVEDIYHWQKVGAIRFYAQLEKFLQGEITIAMRNICNFESMDPREYIKEVTDRLSVERNNMLTLPDCVENQDDLSHLKKLVLAVMLFNPDKDTNSADGVSLISLGIFSDYAISTWGIDDWSSCFQGIKSNCIANGFWEIFPMSKYDDSDVIYLQLDNGISTNWSHIIDKVELKVDKSDWDGQYYLLSEDLLKLHTAIHTGKPLLNRYNDPEIAAKMREQQSQSDEPPKRLRSEQVLLMQELAKRVLGTDTIDMPSKQAEVLLAELSSSVPAEELPSVRSVTRYLGGK
jgi:hypothetical protein